MEEKLGDDIRAAESPLYMSVIEEVEPMEGARELLEELRDRGHARVLASSAPQKEVDHYLDLVDGRELADGWTTADDVEATKPEPDLIRAALEKASSEPENAVLIGDTTWDCIAAKKAGVPTVAVLTGGFSEDELREAGAAMVFKSIEDLRGRLDETPLAKGAG